LGDALFFKTKCWVSIGRGHAPNGPIFTYGQKSDVVIVFLVPNFLNDAEIS